MIEQIEEISGDPLIDIALNTISKDKQMIIFVNTKRSAEAVAERVGIKIKKRLYDKNPKNEEILGEISERLLKALSSPTKQCRRLGKISKEGVAFHHAGLHHLQREIIEDNFKNGNIKIICATPTLAAGVDLPAYRVLIRDLKRYGGSWGMTSIPVLEYEQQAGRAGRPKYDKIGEAICIASTSSEKESIWEEYITGEPEEILSKLAVEPVLRTYILSLVASNYVGSKKELEEFMMQTFYAHQYKNISRLKDIITRMIKQLEEWEFILTNKKEESDFVSASDLGDETDFKIRATKLGERVAELYLDPYTAHYLLVSMHRSSSKRINTYSILQMISWTLEMRPLIKAKQKDMQLIEEKLVEESSDLYTLEPPEYSEEYDEFYNSLKTALVFEEWMNEMTEEKMLEIYQVSPGELNGKIDRADWLLFSCYELSKLQGFRKIANEILKVRIRLSNGVKEELLPLLKLKNIGRVRARRMFGNGVKDLGDVKKIDVSSLAQILGKKVALDVKKQVGQDLSEDKVKIKPTKRKGQVSLDRFDK